MDDAAKELLLYRIKRLEENDVRIEEKVDEIHEVIVKSKGALGAAFLILGSVWAIVTFLKAGIIKLMGL
mgnify:CR=1 FL=1|jgi:hypothetical protein|tara:strand:- start:825 stop:1031 length:207 start_codon:yes stop_codon:yes gene_type:complete